MAKRGRPRRQKDDFAEATALLILAVICVLMLCAIWLVTEHPFAVTIFIGLGFAGAIGLSVKKRALASRQAGEARESIDAIVDQHLETLIRLRAQLVYQNPFGREETTKWNRELTGFVQDFVVPAIPAHSRMKATAHLLELIASIDAKVLSTAHQELKPTDFSESMTSREFEVYCAERLRALGWDARVTQASGDQGVDVIATRSGAKLVVQCKLYTQPVGNKAVQEISAARMHEAARYATVVSNRSFTPSAQRLAGTNRVALLHYSELSAQGLNRAGIDS
jgi:hypothetical protein